MDRLMFVVLTVMTHCVGLLYSAVGKKMWKFKICTAHTIFTTFNDLLSNPKMTAPSRRLLPPPKSEPLSRFNFRRQLFPPL